MEQDMTAIQALEIVDAVTARIPLNRADTLATLRAIQILKTVVENGNHDGNDQT